MNEVVQDLRLLQAFLTHTMRKAWRSTENMAYFGTS